MSECPTFVLFSPSSPPFPGAFRFWFGGIISPAIIQTEFGNHSDSAATGRTDGQVSSLALSQPRLPAATGPRNSVTYFNVFPQPRVRDGRTDGADRPLLSPSNEDDATAKNNYGDDRSGFIGHFRLPAGAAVREASQCIFRAKVSMSGSAAQTTP